MKRIIAILTAILLCLSFISVSAAAADRSDINSADITDEQAQRQAVRAAAAAIIGKSPSDDITVSNDFVTAVLDNVGEDPTAEDISDEISKYAGLFKRKTDEYANAIADDANIILPMTANSSSLSISQSTPRCLSSR